LDEDNEEMGSQKKEPSFPEGVVGEIVQIARNLSQNLTLEEALGEYDKRVNEKECLEVMEILGNENLVVCCLYFFQWMRSHEPSLVTPRAFTVLFPLLGKARMGDKLLVCSETCLLARNSEMFVFIMLQFQVFFLMAGSYLHI
jgi:hypothetical protein